MVFSSKGKGSTGRGSLYQLLVVVVSEGVVGVVLEGSREEEPEVEVPGVVVEVVEVVVSHHNQTSLSWRMRMRKFPSLAMYTPLMSVVVVV